MRFRTPFLLAALCLLPLACASPPVRVAPNPLAPPVNQLAVSGNACGPAALLNAFRCGNATWQRGLLSAPGDTDKSRLVSAIRMWGLRPSQSLAGRKRWSRAGINVDDLCDMANEMGRQHLLPTLRREVFLTEKGETPAHLLERVHGRLDASLARGFPPVVSLRRIALRAGDGKPADWTVVQGHFVTVTRVSRPEPKDASGFEVDYIDPWGGRRGTGRIRISNTAFVTAANTVPPCLEADFPQAKIGKKDIKPGEPTLLTLAAGIGAW